MIAKIPSYAKKRSWVRVDDPTVLGEYHLQTKSTKPNLSLNLQIKLLVWESSRVLALKAMQTSVRAESKCLLNFVP